MADDVSDSLPVLESAADAEGSFRIVSTTGTDGERVALIDVPPLSPANDAAVTIIGRFEVLAKHQNYSEGSVRFRLVAALNACIVAGKMPRSNDQTKILRTHFSDTLGVAINSVKNQSDILKDYESILRIVEPLESVVSVRFGVREGVTTDQLDGDAQRVVALYPTLEKHQFYEIGRNAHRLVVDLNRQLASGKIERNKKGKFYRKLIAERTGIRLAMLCSTYSPIIDDYAKALGGLGSIFEERVPEMRQWLEDRMADRTLELRDGKFNRTQFYTAFGDGAEFWLRKKYPSVDALIEEFDNKIRETGYQPQDVLDTLAALQHAVDTDPPTDQNGLNISRTELERQLGVPVNRFRRYPFVEVIRRAQTDFRKKLIADPFKSVFAEKIFNFGALAGYGWHPSFIVRVIQSFERHYRVKRGEADMFCSAINDILVFIALSDSNCCKRIREKLGSELKAVLLERDWNMATQEYRDSLMVRYSNGDTANKTITLVNSILRNFGNDGVFPPQTLPLLMARNDNATHLPSIVEIAPGAPKGRKPHVDDYVLFATSMLAQAAQAYEVEVNHDDQNGFNVVLRQELEREDFTLAENPAVVILRVLTRRLRLLEEAAQKIWEACKRNWEYGQTLLARGQAPQDDDWSIIIKDVRYNEYDRVQLLRKHFPALEGGNDQGVANLLKVVASRFNYQIPKQSMPGSGGQFFKHRCDEYGNNRTLQSYLTPTSQGISAVLTLYLLASGSNISVGRTLDAECVEPSEEAGYSKITGYKARAKGKPIFATLLTRSPAMRAITWVQKATEGVRQFLGVEDADRLFVSKISVRDGFQLLTESTFRDEFKKIVSEVPELADLPLTPNMLRPSILLKAALESDGRTALSIAIGQHGRTVNGRYTNKLPVRLLHDTDVRQFMHAMETVVIHKIEEVHEFLGISPEGFERRVDVAMKTGLGTYCADRHGRPGNDGGQCESIDCWNDCPQLIVIARPGDVALLQIWQTSLREVEGEWVRDQPERWGEVWLPWLCFVDAVEIKMRNAFPSVWKEAQALASQIMCSPNFKMMRPL